MRTPKQISIRRPDFRACKAAVLARHPGDVVVSRYYHLKHRSKDPARKRLAQQPIDSFIWTEQGGIPSVVTFLNAWAEFSRERADVSIFRFEDFLEDPHTTLARLAWFVGLAPTDAMIEKAVEVAKFENLKERERTGYYDSDRLRSSLSSHNDTLKVRSGKAGGYRTELGVAASARIDEYIRGHLDKIFNYT